ncbi:MAG: glycoside hydrolase domain-containing protein, partial [Promethearchaeota archaeon]
ANYFLIVTAIFWLVDLVYRLNKYRRKAHAISHPDLDTTRRQKTKQTPSRISKIIKIVENINPLKKKAISIAITLSLVASLTAIQLVNTFQYNVRPLLFRNDSFGIWTVDGIVKVERHYQLIMPENAPVDPAIDVSAARGEWEGWHLLITPQPKKSVTITGIEWTNLTLHDNSSITMPTSIIEPFLVHYVVDEQPDRLTPVPPSLTRTAQEGHVDLFWRIRIPRNATAGQYNSTIQMIINGQTCLIRLNVKVFNFTIPKDRHIRSAFGGGDNTEEWYDELEYLRISQYNMGIPFSEGEQYWWNSTLHRFEFNWTGYDEAFQSQLNRGFTGMRQGYFPKRPAEITNDTEWAIIERYFLINVSRHLENHTWIDETGNVHSWVEIPYYYWIDEPGVDAYPSIKEKNDRYHADGESKLRTLLTEEYREEYPVLHDCIDIWCPVIGNFEPSAVTNRHLAGQEYWFYVCVAPCAPYPNLQLWEPGQDPRLIPLICARFNADGFLYWRMNANNNTFRAGFDGNGDGKIAYVDDDSGKLLPSLRLLSYSAGVEDFEYVWLMRITLNYSKAGKIDQIPLTLVEKCTDIENRLVNLIGPRPQLVNHDARKLLEFRNDLANLLEELWPYTYQIYQ